MSKLSLNTLSIGWAEDNNVDTLAELDETLTYNELDDSVALLTYLMGERTAKEYATIGTRISPIIALDETNKLYRVNWSATTPTGTSITVETNVSLDNGATWLGWKVAKNNHFIPDIAKDRDLSIALLQIKQTLETNDSSVTPVLESLGIVADNSDDLNIKENWGKDSSVLGKFNSTLEAGNINNNGVKIVKFNIFRRIDRPENEDFLVGEVDFVNTGGTVDLSYIDYTQPNDKLIYTLIPVGENGLSGLPREIKVNGLENGFSGWWVIDKDTNDVLPFDKAIGSVGNIDTALSQNKVVIETFSQYPRVYKNIPNYETFSLSTVILPDESERSGMKYTDILNKFILSNTPKIVKADNGRIYVCSLSNPRTSQPMNSWRGHDYIQLTVDVTEIDSYENFMKGGSLINDLYYGTV